ncbi:hypothetical protein GCM10011507_28210 [Edaphobacter acidisoli]|uniref:Uncharacterized protein n=1 Tax=Edaphobacter acidisoli TaxID=2040573 RepID=A0A916W889_9BACT|nr:beta-propeller fold lactonase family protein [Edaphobacter acidisoli]GGA75174.1 hypothetical protein GCM10011507_28210 [Edaphobacter acidisoli]
MKLSRIGRVSLALVVSVAMGLGMTACGGGTVGFMWVLGTQYNQIAGFKIDDFTGNLTQVLHSPASSGGVNPVSLVVTPGGRYVYVINQGTTDSSVSVPSGACGGATGGIEQFSVGGGGVLTPQQCFVSQGSYPTWASRDSSGNYLYVLDQQAPTANCSGANATNPTLCYGDITVFSINADTGRLTLVLNQQQKDSNGAQLTYFQVGLNPSMIAFAGGGCLMTLDRGDQTVFPYTVGTGGQLTRPTNSNIALNSVNATSISVNGSSVYITDAGATAASPGGYILPYTVGTSCSLNTANGGAVANLPLTQNPTYSVTDTSGQYLYVLNQSTTNSNQPSYSSISAFTIDKTTGKLVPLNDQNNPYEVGAGPVCMAEDPTGQYFYTSNAVDGTITGKSFYKPYGTLSDLKRGSTFTAVGHATCLAISPNVD